MGCSPLLPPMFWNLSYPGLGSTLPLVLTMLPGTGPLMVLVHSLMGVFFLLVTRVSPWLRLFLWRLLTFAVTSRLPTWGWFPWAGKSSIRVWCLLVPLPLCLWSLIGLLVGSYATDTYLPIARGLERWAAGVYGVSLWPSLSDSFQRLFVSLPFPLPFAVRPWRLVVLSLWSWTNFFTGRHMIICSLYW